MVFLDYGLKSLLKLVLLIAVMISSMPAMASAAGGTELLWYGHSAFKLTTPSGKVVLIDPWITNPVNKNGKEDLAKIAQANLILVSHDHFDHVGDAVEIAKKTGAPLVSTFDVGKALVQYEGYPKAQAGYETQGNFGGELTLLDGEVKIAFIPAVHSSTVAPSENSLHYGGNPGGFLISVKNGPVIYHTGDTDLFSDMALIPHFHKVSVMLACIGDHFTMGPNRAAEAVKLVKPATVVPIHFGTFPVLNGTPEAFETALKRQNVNSKLKLMQVGEAVKLT